MNMQFPSQLSFNVELIILRDFIYLFTFFYNMVHLPSSVLLDHKQYEIMSYLIIFVQVFDDKSINFGSLPSALRRVMVAKFPGFDQYQLGKLTICLLII